MPEVQQLSRIAGGMPSLRKQRPKGSCAPGLTKVKARHLFSAWHAKLQSAAATAGTVRSSCPGLSIFRSMVKTWTGPPRRAAPRRSLLRATLRGQSGAWTTLRSELLLSAPSATAASSSRLQCGVCGKSGGWTKAVMPYARLTHPTCSFTPCERMSRASKVRPRAAADPLGFFLKEAQGKPRQAATGGQALSPTRQCRLTSELEARRPSRCLNVHKRLHRRTSELTAPVPPRPFPALAGRASSAHRHRPLR
jgi:hypothetical protein